MSRSWLPALPWPAFLSAKSPTETRAPVTPRANRTSVSPLDTAAISDDSRSNQDESEVEKRLRDVQEILRIATDARVHVAKTKVERAWLYTDFVLSTDSTHEVNMQRIKRFIADHRNAEIYEVFEADNYVPVQIPGFPTEHHEWRPTLVIRVHATLVVYTPCRYWTSRVTAAIQMLLLHVFLSIAVYVLYLRQFR